MIELRETARFARWLSQLRDPRAKAKILVRLRRLSLGNPGDVKAVGGGVSELRIDWGPGYRIYFATRGESQVILLAGGDKRSQEEDLRIARRMAIEIEE